MKPDSNISRAQAVARSRLRTLVVAVAGLAAAAGVQASPIVYNNLQVTNAMASASRPDTAGFEIESADDFVLTQTTSIDHASFIGLFKAGTTGLPAVSQIRLEIYRVFPLDSDTTRTLHVPTRTNSPSDVALDAREFSSLAFTTSVLSPTFTALNSVAPGGIHPSPGQTTGGNGPVTGQEVQFEVDLLTPFVLGAGHYFFIPQVLLNNGGEFYWLSASRPISGPGTTPFAPDLQSWTRDQFLDPDWLRIGTDIVGGATPPQFNAAFALRGQAVPEPPALGLFAAGALVALLARRRRLPFAADPR